MLRAASILVALVLASAPAFGADQPIAGKKLLIKNPLSGVAGNKVVHLGKDVSITVGAAGGAGDPQCGGVGGGGGSLRIAASGGAGDVTIPLPCGGWTTNGTNSLYKYKDTTGATCTLVLVKNGALAKAICRGTQVGIDLNGSMSPTVVVTTLNANRYCTEYGGDVVKDGSDDKTFLRKDASPPPTCPSTTSTTTSSSTTSTDLFDRVCCQFSPSVAAPCGGMANYECVNFGGAPTYDAVCNGSGTCVSPPGSPGNCCDNLSGYPDQCYATDAGTCASAGVNGTFHPASVCQPSGDCTP
jgi:hypothetical protein